MKYRIKNEKLAELVYSVFDEADVQRMIAKQIEEMDFDPIILCSYDDFDKSGNLVTKVKPECEGLDNKRCSVSIFINEEEIKKIREYVSDDWNPYPEITPPREGFYLVQWKRGQEGCGRNFPLDVSYWGKNRDWTGIEAFRELPELYKPEE